VSTDALFLKLIFTDMESELLFGAYAQTIVRPFPSTTCSYSEATLLLTRENFNTVALSQGLVNILTPAHKNIKRSLGPPSCNRPTVLYITWSKSQLHILKGVPITDPHRFILKPLVLLT